MKQGEMKRRRRRRTRLGEDSRLMENKTIKKENERARATKEQKGWKDIGEGRIERG